MKRYACIHGHFYQPPRENPWLEAIEQQDSANPYHDWNERITDECYRPNAESRIIDHEGRVCRIVNNYSRISFNLGPTLMSWLEEHAPTAYADIADADRLSREHFDGHGSALAQPYNHMIMPLANKRDRVTQLRWGIADFKRHFNRDPKGVWLPETAADTNTLQDLVDHGIKFTILAPRQAKRFRKTGDKSWTNCADSGGIDPSRAYRCTLPSGDTIALFFYDGPISQAVAFERLLNNGQAFAARLRDAFSPDRDWNQLAHLATDGESYGHHHRHGEMALAVALDTIEQDPDVHLTNYAQFLELNPPDHEAEIHENSSWSCVHGVERWRNDCGCNASGNPGWNQQYRKPLREALDKLRDRLATLYERQAGEHLKDPWHARDEYINVIHNRDEQNVLDFFDKHATQPLPEADRVRVAQLLEMQRHAMLMYTSCGWFFDEISGLESVQVLKYAARAVQLAESLSGTAWEPEFLKDLERCPSNIPERANGRAVYNQLVRPAIVDLPRVCAHYAVTSLFQEPDEQRHDSIYCYRAESLAEHRSTAGKTTIAVGRVRLTSSITLDSSTLTYAVLHAGDHIISGGARPTRDADSFSELTTRVCDAFEAGDIAGVIHAMESEFGSTSFSLGSLFADEQRRIAEALSANALAQVEAVYESLHEQHQTLVRYLSGLGIPVHDALRLPSKFTLNRELIDEINAEQPRPDHVAALVNASNRERVPLDTDLIAFTISARISDAATALLDQPSEDTLKQLDRYLDIVEALPFDATLDRAQLSIYRVAGDPDRLPKERRDTLATLVSTLAKRLNVKLPGPASTRAVQPTA